MYQKPLLIANWKSQKTAESALAWVRAVSPAPAGLDVVIAPGFTLLSEVKAHLPEGWQLGAQDASAFPLGAYTGAVAADQLKDVGVRYCIVGHSERRRLFHETSQEVVNKVEQLLSAHVRPVVCVDQPYFKEQLGLLGGAGITSADIDIAYEPLAAIGTGNTADPTAVTQFLEQMRTEWQESRVLYGGSVNADNIGEFLLISQGALIATASLEAESMNAIIAQAIHSAQ